MSTKTILAFAVLLFLAAPEVKTAEGYQNFRAALYARAQEVQQMADLDWLRTRFEAIEKQVRISKVYVETHRDKILVNAETLEKAKAYFAEKGIATAGGITLTIDEGNRFQTFCYSDPEHRARVQEIVEHTARHFDEVILDDFFFTSCKSEVEIEAKGDRTWTEYRLALLDEVARNVILGPARKANPNVKVVIKYPNWYDHFHGLGFNLERGPRIFDAVYTGTETRDATFSDQHLQPYHGYNIWRYLENLRPGHNAGGWVDPFGSFTLDRYAEQLWITLFAGSPEITLFAFGAIQMPVREGQRAPWQDQGTSLDFDAVAAPFRQDDGSLGPELTFARVAGWSLEKIDPLIGQLGEPVGIPSYKPFHSTGEDFLHNFMGMVGIPIDLRPAFPAEAPLVLLTEATAHDPDIVGKIEKHVRSGNSVVITSGLLRALQDRGIQQVAELEVLDQRALVEDFRVGFGRPSKASKKILIPQLRYFTNDSWALIDAFDGPMGWPLLHDADYGEGHLFVWVIPDNPADLYALPEAALDAIRRTVSRDFGVRIGGPSKVVLLVYDNDTLILQSFRDEAVEVEVLLEGESAGLRDLESGDALAGEKVPEGQGWFRSPDAGKTRVEVSLKPHSYRAFKKE